MPRYGPRWLHDNVLAATVVLTVVGYGLVAATFAGVVPIFPDIGETGVNWLGHAIAVVNSLATVCLVVGWYWIRRDEVRKHAIAMTSAFVLILLFLLMYLPKVGGGGQKELVESAPELAALAYFAMLAIHIVLSVVAMPVVLYAFLLGITQTTPELRRSSHARVGRVAAAAWVLSLVLGVITYVVLNHLYGYEFVPA